MQSLRAKRGANREKTRARLASPRKMMARLVVARVHPSENRQKTQILMMKGNMIMAKVGKRARRKRNMKALSILPMLKLTLIKNVVRSSWNKSELNFATS